MRSPPRRTGALRSEPGIELFVILKDLTLSTLFHSPLRNSSQVVLPQLPGGSGGVDGVGGVGGVAGVGGVGGVGGVAGVGGVGPGEEPRRNPTAPAWRSLKIPFMKNPM